jgi:flagellar hook-basal body complex protein FliE
MINLNGNVSGTPNSMKNVWEANSLMPKANNAAARKLDFDNTAKVIEKFVSNVDESQQSSDMSIKDLLSGKNEDIISVVSAAAKADMSFKLLVGVRNKLIEAYKQTMNMPL